MSPLPAFQQRKPLFKRLLLPLHPSCSLPPPPTHRAPPRAVLRAVAQLLVTQPPTLSHSLPLAQSKGESVFEDSDLPGSRSSARAQTRVCAPAALRDGQLDASGCAHLLDIGEDLPRCRRRPVCPGPAAQTAGRLDSPRRRAGARAGAAAAVGHLSTCRPRCPRGHCCIQPVFAFTSVAGYAGPSSSLRTH